MKDQPLEELSFNFSRFKNRVYTTKNCLQGGNCLPTCENNRSGTSSDFLVTDCLEKSFTGTRGLKSQIACLRMSLKKNGVP